MQSAGRRKGTGYGAMDVRRRKMGSPEPCLERREKKGGTLDSQKETSQRVRAGLFQSG